MRKVYENCKIYGPYKSQKDNRLRVIIVNGKEKKTVSYPKYLIEIELNRYLAENETVHHIDGNPLNNDLSNLKILDRIVHSKQDSIIRCDEVLICQWCKNEFTVKGKKLHHRNRKQNNSNSFCSRRCSGQYGKFVQMYNLKFDKVHIQERYIRNSVNEELNIGEILTCNDDDNTEA